MFDPTLPQAGTEIDADQMRSQLNGLHDLILAIIQIVAAQVDGVTTLNPGDPASATVVLTGGTLHFTFAIPAGEEGAQGAPGEVTMADLNTAIAGTSSNSNVVDLLEMTVGDPPTQGEVQTIADRLDQLITALRR